MGICHFVPARYQGTYSTPWTPALGTCLVHLAKQWPAYILPNSFKTSSSQHFWLHNTLYELTIWSQVVKQLVALCNVLVTADIIRVQKEQRNTFLSPNGIINIHPPADLESLFVKNCLRKLDHNDNLSNRISNNSIPCSRDFWTGHLYRFTSSFDG